MNHPEVAAGLIGIVLLTSAAALPGCSAEPAGSNDSDTGGTPSSVGGAAGGAGAGGAVTGAGGAAGPSGGGSPSGGLPGSAGNAAQGGSANAAGAGGGAGGFAGGGMAGTNSAGGAGAGAGGTAGSSAGGPSVSSAGGMGGMSGAGGASGAASTGCLPSYLRCEDFEGTSAGQVPAGWTARGMARVAEDQAHGGKRALKISPANNGERRIVRSTPMLGAQHWGRLNYRVQLPVPQAFVHSTLVGLSGRGPTVGTAEFSVVDTVKSQGVDGNHQFLYNVQPQGAEFGTGSSYDYGFEDAWRCAEWHVDATTQTYQFFYQGKQVISFTRGAGNYQGSELPMTFEEVRVGWNNYQSAPPGFTAWIDDFVIDEQRIGCPTAP